MSPTMIMVLTATVACGFGHPLHLLKHNRFLFEGSIYLNKSSWNASLNTANYTDVLHMNMSQASKNKTEVFPVGGDSPLQNEGNGTNGDLPQLKEVQRNYSLKQSGPTFTCRYSLCASVELADNLSKGGDEVAGSDTKSPWSPGK